MKAIWFEDTQWSMRDLPEPAPETGQILATVRYCGICNTDLELLRGYMDFTGIPGHEWVGIDKNGNLITSEINFGCGACPDCQGGDPRHCATRTVLGIAGQPGAMAQQLLIPSAATIAIPAFIPELQAVFLEPLAAALQILAQIEIAPQSDVLLVGSGKLGQLVADVLLRRGCRLYVHGRNAAKNAIIARKGGIVLAANHSQRFATVIEATGNSAGLTFALEHLAAQGRLVLKSTYAGDVPLPLWRIVVDEIALIGSRCGRIKNAIAFWDTQRPDYSELVSGVYPIGEFAQALRHAQDPSALKIIIACQ